MIYWNAFMDGVISGFTWRATFKTFGWFVPSMVLAFLLGFETGWKTWVLLWCATTLNSMIDKGWSDS